MSFTRLLLPPLPGLILLLPIVGETADHYVDFEAVDLALLSNMSIIPRQLRAEAVDWLPLCCLELHGRPQDRTWA
jgi:hypothetical protein